MADEIYGAEPPAQLYGVNAGQPTTTFREKLTKLFGATDFVRVVNIDKDDFTWQALDPKDETYNIVPGPQKTTFRRLPKLFTIGAGKSMVLEGWNAYLMIENLYKYVAAKDRIARKTPSQQADPKYVTSFVWDDNEQQQYYIDKIFVGIEQPSFGEYQIAKPQSETNYEMPTARPADEVFAGEQYKTETVGDIAKDLGLDDAATNSPS